MNQVISPLDIADGVDPSEASLLLSTVAVALANCGRLGPYLDLKISLTHLRCICYLGIQDRFIKY